jgi:hypothetical protein
MDVRSTEGEWLYVKFALWLRGDGLDLTPLLPSPGQPAAERGYPLQTYQAWAPQPLFLRRSRHPTSSWPCTCGGERALPILIPGKGFEG